MQNDVYLVRNLTNLILDEDYHGIVKILERNLDRTISAAIEQKTYETPEYTEEQVIMLDMLQTGYLNDLLEYANKKLDEKDNDAFAQIMKGIREIEQLAQTVQDKFATLMNNQNRK